MRLYYKEGKEPEHSEVEVLEKLYEKVLKKEENIRSICERYEKLFQQIDEQWEVEYFPLPSLPRPHPLRRQPHHQKIRPHNLPVQEEGEGLPSLRQGQKTWEG